MECGSRAAAFLVSDLFFQPLQREACRFDPMPRTFNHTPKGGEPPELPRARFPTKLLVMNVPRPALLLLLATLPLLDACHTPKPGQSAPTASETTEQVRNMQRRVAGHQLTYLLQTPSGPRPKEGWPLLLFLHGYGECGSEIEKVRKHGPPKLIGQFPALQSCVVVSPQCPSDSWWRVDALKALVDEVIEIHGDIDTTRRYVTGLSMGGYGTWCLAARYPDYFAAALPICGGGDPFRLPANRPPEKVGIVNEFDPEGLRQAQHLPVWTFHGVEDTSVPILETERLVQLLRQGGNDQVQFTSLPGIGHVAAWQTAYRDPAVWAWLFAQ